MQHTPTNHANSSDEQARPCDQAFLESVAKMITSWTLQACVEADDIGKASAWAAWTARKRMHENGIAEASMIMASTDAFSCFGICVGDLHWVSLVREESSGTSVEALCANSTDEMLSQMEKRLGASCTIQPCQMVDIGLAHIVQHPRETTQEMKAACQAWNMHKEVAHIANPAKPRRI